MNIQFMYVLRSKADQIAAQEGYERDYLDIIWEIAEPMIKSGEYTEADYDGIEETIFTQVLGAAGVI